MTSNENKGLNVSGYSVSEKGLLYPGVNEALCGPATNQPQVEFGSTGKVRFAVSDTTEDSQGIAFFKTAHEGMPEIGQKINAIVWSGEILEGWFVKDEKDYPHLLSKDCRDEPYYDPCLYPWYIFRSWNAIQEIEE